MSFLRKRIFTVEERPSGLKIHRAVIGGNKIEIKETPDKQYHAMANEDPHTIKLNMDEGSAMGWLARIVGRR